MYPKMQLNWFYQMLITSIIVLLQYKFTDLILIAEMIHLYELETELCGNHLN